VAEQVAFGVWKLPQLSPVALLEAETNCYLLQTEDGAMVVDPPSPEPGAVAAIEAVIDGWGMRLAGIVATHGHRDHIGGVAALYRATGERAWIAGHERLRPALAQAPGMPPLEDERWRPLGDGDSLADFEVLATPGHTADHIGLWRAMDGLLIAGDIVAGEGTVVIVPPDGDMSDYLATLQRLRDLAPRTIAPGHGPIVHRPVELLDYYISHRLEREAAVLAALSDEPRPLRVLVPIVYSDVDPARYGLAEHSLLAHLIKLRREGKAEERPEGWIRIRNR
jgi:glyoxylase-like metal-dependent hydrolase (beta-lactamase superfamily II)